MNFRYIYEQLIKLDSIPVNLLGESFKIIERNFGTDLANKKWDTVNNPLTGEDGIRITFFKADKLYILMVDKNNGVKFNIIPSIEDLEKYQIEEWYEFFKYNRSPGGLNVNALLGTIFSILKRSTNKLNTNTFSLVGADKKLHEMYLFFANNKTVNDYLRKNDSIINVKINSNGEQYIEVQL